MSQGFAEEIPTTLTGEVMSRTFIDGIKALEILRQNTVQMEALVFGRSDWDRQLEHIEMKRSVIAQQDTRIVAVLTKCGNIVHGEYHDGYGDSHRCQLAGEKHFDSCRREELEDYLKSELEGLHPFTLAFETYSLKDRPGDEIVNGHQPIQGRSIVGHQFYDIARELFHLNAAIKRFLEPQVAKVWEENQKLEWFERKEEPELVFHASLSVGNGDLERMWVISITYD